MSESVGVQIGWVCPGCGREDSIPLIQGLPGAELWLLAERGLVALGGCEIEPDDPALVCRTCGLHWGQEGDPTADEAELAELLGVRYADVVRALGTGWRRESPAGERDHLQWFVSGEPDGGWARAGLRGEALAAPAHVYVGISNVLRRAVLSGKLARDIAALAHRDLVDLPMTVFPF